MAVFWGQYGLPMPYKHDIISLVGKPIPGKTACAPHLLPSSLLTLHMMGCFASACGLLGATQCKIHT